MGKIIGNGSATYDDTVFDLICGLETDLTENAAALLERPEWKPYLRRV